MPSPKKLNCKEVLKVANEFFGGASVKALAEHFKVSRTVITRILERQTYRDCPEINIMVQAIGGISIYLEEVDKQMETNKRTGRGNRKVIG